MAEFGLTAAIGREGLGKLIAVILDETPRFKREYNSGALTEDGALDQSSPV